jgi:hypothetical protein
VRVPKLPLSMVAVDSNTPSSISATDIVVSGVSLVIQLVSRVSSQPGERESEYGYGRRSKRPTCPRSGEPGRHYRRPPDADWAASLVKPW